MLEPDPQPTQDPTAPFIARPQRHGRGRLERFRIALGALIVDGFFKLGSRLAGWLPFARPGWHGLERIPDLPYLETGDPIHRLDLYRPRDAKGPLPVVFYVHGGGFRMLSKESHWIMALVFARRGYLVANINYRLAPRHPFPAPLEDASAAYTWVSRHIHEYGGNPEHIILAGESAGANLVLALTIALCWRRPEPWLARLFDQGRMPRAVLPSCGMLQVSDPERVRRRRKLSIWVHDRLVEVADALLGAAEVSHPEALAMADPLLVLEQASPPERPLPPMMAIVGTRDPLLDDTRRLQQALDRLDARCVIRFYRGMPHAFHAFVVLKEARQAWRDTFEFLSSLEGDSGERRALKSGGDSAREV